MLRRAYLPFAMFVLGLVAGALALLGCSSFIEKRAADSTYRILQQSTEAAQRLPDLELARAAMPGGILQLEAFARAYPEHPGFKTMFADAICQYGTAFVFDDWEDASLGGREAEAAKLATRIDTLLAMCVDANLALLPPAWRTARTQGTDAVTALLPAVTRAQAPQLLWLATADAVRIAIEPMKGVSKLPAVTALLERVSRLAPGLRGADAQILLGTLDAGRFPFFGGSDGRAHFARARELAGQGALIVDVMFARGTLVARKDRAAFEATLNEVLAADVERWPERRLGNELALRKARRYLAAVDVLIPPVPAPPAPAEGAPTTGSR